MARRRGFFAELQHQAAVAERNRQRQVAANYRAFQQQQREAARLAAAAQRAREQAARADARAQAAAEKEAQRLYTESRVAEAEAMTAEAEMVLKEIDEILLATLDVDDYVDLETLRTTAEHPPFESPHQAAPPHPRLHTPAPLPPYAGPSGSGKRTGRRAEQSAAADRAFMAAVHHWWETAAQLEQQHQAALIAFEQAEQERHQQLAADRSVYDRECAQREAAATRTNKDLDDLIRGLAAGEADAVRQYFEIVLQNSAYPDSIDLEYDLCVDVQHRELTVTVILPEPDALPTEKAFKYVKARDEIAPVTLTQTEQKQRYASVLSNIAMRTIHELFEADRTQRIATLSLTAGVAHISPATGHEAISTLLAVAVDRTEFDRLNLGRIDANAALAHLGAEISKNPWNLTPIANQPGVRTR